MGFLIDLRNKLKNSVLCKMFFVILIFSSNSVFANFAYVANFGDNTVSVINTATNQVTVPAIAVGSIPFGIAVTPNGKFAYVTNFGSNAVSVIDTGTNAVTVPAIIVGSSPKGIAITPDGNSVYVANSGSNTVSVIDTGTNTVIGAPIAVGNSPVNIAITPDGKFAYVTNSISNTVSIINTSTKAVSTIPLPFPFGFNLNPSGIAITPNGNLAYVTSTAFGTVLVIDTKTNLITVPTIQFFIDALTAIAVTPDGNFAYVVGNNAVSAMNTSTNATGPVIGGVGTNWIAITPNGHFAYVSNFSKGTVSVINLETNAIDVFAIPVGTKPLGIAITPNPESFPVTATPLNLRGYQKKNDFAVVYELFNRLQWEANLSFSAAGYFVYRNGIKIATLNASTFEYDDHNIKKEVTTVYEVSAFDAKGDESDLIAIEIK